MTLHRFGWIPSHPDIRDIKYSVSFEAPITELPPSVDLSTSPFMPPIADQGDLGSCTSFATCAAFDYLAAKNGAGWLEPSHLFQYYNSRLLEGTVQSDAGASIRDAIKVTSKYGMCPESMWPYDVTKFENRPTLDCYREAAEHEVATYLAVNNSNLNDLLVCLAGGNPIVFGCTLYTSFEQPHPDFIIPLPQKTESVLGGHAQLIVGYDSAKQLFKVRNSWGTTWADGGYEYMPFSYLTSTSLSSDFWTLRNLSSIDTPRSLYRQLFEVG